MERLKRRTSPAGTLRRQVSVEGRKRDLVYFTVILLVALYLGFTIVAGDRGLLKYLETEKSRKTLQAEIQRAERENRVLQREVEGLRKDPFYMEKHAREEYGLAKPDELIFQFKEDGR